MGYDLNFQLLGQPVDVGSAVQAGYQRGREMRLQNMQESAFDMLARDPNSAAGRALLVRSGRPDLARQFRQWGREDLNEDMRRRALGLPPMSALGGPAVTPAPSAFAPMAPANTPTAPAGSPPAMAPPAPSAPPTASGGRLNLDQDVMRQWFASDPAGAREFLTSWDALNDAQREIATQRFTAAIPVLVQALSVPYEQRRALIQGQTADLTANGWSAEEIASFDPTDANVQLLVRRGLPIAQQRDFFAPSEAAPGTVGRNRFSNDVMYANPTQPRTEVSYDADGNEILSTVAGQPAIGPGAYLFGGGAQAGAVAPATAPQVGEVRRGYRYKGGDPASPASWERVGGAQTSSTPDLDNWNRAGRGGSQGPRTFP